jgi:hypothetical protein
MINPPANPDEMESISSQDTFDSETIARDQTCVATGLRHMHEPVHIIPSVKGDNVRLDLGCYFP